MRSLGMATETSLRLLQLEKVWNHQRRPSTVKNKSINLKILKKEQKNIYNEKYKSKQVGMAILISKKADLRTRNTVRDKRDAP